MKNSKQMQQGFTLVEIMIVVAIIGLLAAIAIPNFVKARETAQMNSCVNNLRQVDGAKQQWALETRQATNATPVASDIAPYLGRAGTAAALTSMKCPASGTTGNFGNSYTINAVNVAPDCQVVTTHELE